MRNLQDEQVKKAFCFQKLFWPFTIRINCLSALKSFSRWLEQIFLTVGQNNFDNKLPFFESQIRSSQCAQFLFISCLVGDKRLWLCEDTYPDGSLDEAAEIPGTYYIFFSHSLQLIFVTYSVSTVISKYWKNLLGKIFHFINFRFRESGYVGAKMVLTAEARLILYRLQSIGH